MAGISDGLALVSAQLPIRLRERLTDPNIGDRQAASPALDTWPPVFEVLLWFPFESNRFDWKWFI
jgi:hypothetical protein